MTPLRLRRARVELRILERLRKQRLLDAVEVRRLTAETPFYPFRLLAMAQRLGAVKWRKGRVGGLAIANEAKFRQRIADLEVATRSMQRDDISSLSDASVVAAALEAAGVGSALPYEPPFHPDSWEAAVTRILARRYEAWELHDMLPFDFTDEYNEVVLLPLATEVDVSAEQVAGWHVELYGSDLLANCPDLRDRLADDAGLPRLKRFPGTPAAYQFVQNVGLPIELAGVPELDRQPAVLPLVPHRTLRPLMDYQQPLRADAFDVLLGGGRAMLSSPTGSGKTRIAAEALLDLIDAVAALPDAAERARNVVLWLAHTNELLDQACEGLRDVWDSRQRSGSALLVRLWGHNTADALRRIPGVDLPARDAVIIVSTPATIATLLDQHWRSAKLHQAIVERCRTVIVDEAHRAAAPSYLAITDVVDRAEAPVALLGLSATPFRETYSSSEGVEETSALMRIFGRLIVPTALGPDPARTLVEMGVLPRVEFVDVETDIPVDLSAEVQRLVRRRPGQPLTVADEASIDRLLAGHSMSQPARRHAPLVRQVREIASDPQTRTLVFCPNLGNAQVLCVQLCEAGIPAAFVSARTRRARRRRLVEAFRSGAIRVLINYEVLTTGFDAPRVTHVVIARQTVSLVLYTQMVGRGLRGPAVGGTDVCVVVNVIDQVKLGSMVLAHLTYRRVWERGLTGSTGQPGRRVTPANSQVIPIW